MDKIVMVYGRGTIDEKTISMFSEKDLIELINEELVDQIRKQILKGINELPISKTIDEALNQRTYTLKINIISDEEVKRLKAIEKRYNTLMEAFSKQGMNVEFLKKEEQ